MNFRHDNRILRIPASFLGLPLLLLLMAQTSWAFPISNPKTRRITRHPAFWNVAQHYNNQRPFTTSSRLCAAATNDNDNGDGDTTATEIEIVDRSTLSLLEHINFNIPSQELAVPFYYDILGCGVDPRMASNFVLQDDDDDETKEPDLDSTIWANCGASQFHLCYNHQTSATIPGRVGLRYDNLDGLEQRLNAEVMSVLTEAAAYDDENNKDAKEPHKQCFQSYMQERDSQGNPQITVVDRYNNIFVCRQVNDTSLPSTSAVTAFKQPIISSKDNNEDPIVTKLAQRYGRPDQTECRGIDYVEIPVQPEQAEQIAAFYEGVFDATTFVVHQTPMLGLPDTVSHLKIAMIALGNIQANGRADQYLLFQEVEEQPSSTSSSQPQPQVLPAGYHHLALYVGESTKDFDQAYKNADLAGVIWINPRFADKVDTLAKAKLEHQFRFKNIVDLETGDVLLELEHEIRSIEHPSWPGHYGK